MSSLQLMAERMNLDTDKPRLSRYANAVQVLADLRKLQRLSLGRPGLPELGTYTGTKTLRIPVTGSIPFTNRLKEIGSHPIFRRLQHAVQLGLTYYVFPGATHTRLEHSYGVFANVARYINSLLSDDYQPYFRQVADEQKVATTLVAGLLHDLGQSSFAHVLEDVGLIDGHEKLSAAFLVGDKTDAYLRDPYRSDTTMADILRRHWPEVDLRRLEWMINPGPGLPFDPGWDIMRNIISGPLDADKTDYLLRDALHAGVEYPRSIDMARFMNSLTASVIREGDRNRGVLAITWKGAQPAEMITLARTQMFWVLYWHHTVRAAHAMLAHATHHHMTACNKREQRALIQSLFCASIDELLAQLCASTSRRASDLARNLRVRQLYKRGFSLEYNEDSAIYMGLMDKKEACDRAKDPLLRTLSAKLAVMMTKTLRDNGRRTQIRTDQVIVDIPKRGKDALPPIYILSKAQGGPETYLSKGIIGSNEEWENRARMVSVFLAPEIAAEDRAQLQQSKMMLLNSI
jgi:HD superfamily phosphohydrolase